MEKIALKRRKHPLWVCDWDLLAFTQTSVHEAFLKPPPLPS